MILISDFSEFIRQIGLVAHIDDFEHLNIRPCTLLGSFEEHRVPELLDFCLKNPRFHIVSHLENSDVNRFDGKGLFYRIASGDKNPNIIYSPKLKSGFHL